MWFSVVMSCIVGPGCLVEKTSLLCGWLRQAAKVARQCGVSAVGGLGWKAVEPVSPNQGPATKMLPFLKSAVEPGC